MRHGKLEDGFMGPAIFCKGEDYIEQAWEAETAVKRARLARKGLDADLDNIDGYILLSHSAKTMAETIALLREAVRVGDRLWGSLLEDDEMEWWGFIGTRPYMRALHELGLALQEAGDRDEALAAYQRLLKLNPNDNQGVRALVILLLMEGRKIGDLRRLLKEYPDDFLIDSIMARLWLLLRGKAPDMTRLGAEIIDRNKFVLPMLVGRGPKEKDIEASAYGITLGGADEALEYCTHFGAIWDKLKGSHATISRFLDHKVAGKSE